MPPKFTRGAKGKGLMRSGSSKQGPSKAPVYNPYEGSDDSSSPWEPYPNLPHEYSPPSEPHFVQQPSDSHHSYHSYHSHSHSSHGNYNVDIQLRSQSVTPPEDSPEPMEEDSEPELPATGSMGHPIDILSGSNSYNGTPHHYTDSYEERWGQYVFYNTPSVHNTPSQHDTPSYHTPPQELPVEHPLPPPPPRRRGARMSMRLGPRVGSLSPNRYPTIPEDPQMGRPSHTSPFVEHQPQPTVEPEPQPPFSAGEPSSLPPSGFDNPIPSYLNLPAYNPFEPSTWPEHSHGHNVPLQDPYQEMAMNAHYPNPYPYQPGGYPYYSYQHPVAPSQPQPQTQPQQPPPTIEVLTEALEKVKELQEQTAKDNKKNNKLLKRLVKKLRGKKD